MVDVASPFDPLKEAKENGKVKNYTEILMRSSRCRRTR